LSRLLVFVYFLETGLLLLVVPWSVFWERNGLAERVPFLRSLLLNHFVRGAISGVGLICLAAAVAEIVTLWRRRAQAGTAPTAPAADADLSR
jgi:hypothetical protein